MLPLATRMTMCSDGSVRQPRSESSIASTKPSRRPSRSFDHPRRGATLGDDSVPGAGSGACLISENPPVSLIASTLTASLFEIEDWIDLRIAHALSANDWLDGEHHRTNVFACIAMVRSRNSQERDRRCEPINRAAMTVATIPSAAVPQPQPGRRVVW